MTDATVGRLAGAVDGHDVERVAAVSAGFDDVQLDEGVVFRFPDLRVWVEEALLAEIEVWVSKVRGQSRWCEQWWAHPEVVGRLMRCWFAWEAVKTDAEGLARWQLEVLDPHLHALLDGGDEGPFAKCGPGLADGEEPKHAVAPRLPSRAAPEGWFAEQGLVKPLKGGG
jgi:hypothetical protein